MSTQLRSPSLRSPLSVARGHGSAKEGTAHFRAQRVSSIALLPLTAWFIASVIGQLGKPYEHVIAWLSSPWVATGAVLFIGTLFYHAHLGLQTVIEDYLASHGPRIVALLLVNGILLVLGTGTVLAIIRTAL